MYIISVRFKHYRLLVHLKVVHTNTLKTVSEKAMPKVDNPYECILQDSSPLLKFLIQAYSFPQSAIPSIQQALFDKRQNTLPINPVSHHHNPKRKGLTPRSAWPD